MNPHLKGLPDSPPTFHEVELSQLDLRYEGHRLKQIGLEERLLASIAQRGIQEPLEGVRIADAHVLLNGFKRYRCALKLNIYTVRFLSLGSDEVVAILNLLRVANSKSLSLLEQARFIDELREVRGMSVPEIAEELSRSKAWVSMRLGLLAQMTPAVREALFAGAFPVYAYMYTVRSFMRMNGVTRSQVDEFVGALRGKRFSVREIEQLAHGFFRGPESFRQEILKGNLALALKQMDQAPRDPDSGTEFERVLIGDLESLQKYMHRVMGKSQDPRLKSRGFFAQAHLLTAGILSRAPVFLQTLRQFHDRIGQA